MVWEYTLIQITVEKEKSEAHCSTSSPLTPKKRTKSKQIRTFSSNINEEDDQAAHRSASNELTASGGSSRKTAAFGAGRPTINQSER